MREAFLPSSRQAHLARLYAASALACLLACAVPLPAFSQEVGKIATNVPSGSQMLLAADTLVYNNDNQTVTAVGVRLEADDTLSVIAPLGTEDLLGLECRPTVFGRTQLKEYHERIATKRWRELWPRVRFVE